MTNNTNEEIKSETKPVIALDKELELQLIQKSINGDRDSFDYLLNYEKSRFESFRYYYSKLSQSDFDDCWQKASLKAYLNLKSFSFKCSFHTWFYTILKNEVLALFNKNTLSNTREVSLTSFYSDVIDLYSIEENTPFTSLAKKEKAEKYSKILNECFSTLHESDKQILEMALVQDKSYKEIAKELNLSTTSVGTRLFYAKKYAKRKILKNMNVKNYASL